MYKTILSTCLFIFVFNSSVSAEQVRARDLGIKPGILNTGTHNAITDVEGVLVGHVTLMKGDSIRTGATAILPHGGNIYQDKVPAAVVIGNGFGKMMGYSQIHELGEIETPIVLTNTLSVPRAADAILDWTLRQDGNEAVRSVNTVVGETNDAGLNDIRGRHLTPEIIMRSIEDAKRGPVAEGDIGAGKGTSAFGWKGGIGTSSRVLPGTLGGYTVGVLVQSNYGGTLMMDGVPVGEELNQYYLKGYVDSDIADGSIMMVVATDAPLSDRNLERLAKRALTGLARTGSAMTNGSGDYVISFSTADSVRRTAVRRNNNAEFEEVPNNSISPLFQAVAEATEEAVYNSLLMARSVTSKNVRTGETRTIDELPVDKVREILKKYAR
ncbi:MAG: P1 family peptidase [Kordiimonadaceae bacterium]|jgi:D-aminopeptidase|nr:P1 family peptidase [Kordiimonadaceae bacterium]MBT6035850.1 P1 family peptidase [Kordiimonadaceae bacterium]MBT6329622.1 P1 family peptidase [Kordiimonadaceae bacterium]MBT7582478.1 P1 family peptidase [Kordiimonadaceae bacterium]